MELFIGKMHVMIASPHTSVLSRVMADVKMNAETARLVLKINFQETENRRMDELLSKSNEGALSPAEREELQEFCIVGDLLSLLHLHARDALGLPLTLHGA